MEPVASLPAHRAHEGVFPRLMYGLNAVFAWIGVLISVTSSSLMLYHYDQPNPHLYQEGTTPLLRLANSFSYFTMWSNLLVAIVMTILVIAPARGRIFQVFRLDALLMITVTGIIYWGLLAGNAVNQGIDVVGNMFNHMLTPIITVVIWLIVGPRNWIRWWTPLAALILPIVWAVFALARGAVIGQYPYPFLDVATRGMTNVLVTIVEIAVFGLVIGFLYYGIDLLLSGKARRSAAEVAPAAEAAPVSAG